MEKKCPRCDYKLCNKSLVKKEEYTLYRCANCNNCSEWDEDNVFPALVRHE